MRVPKILDRMAPACACPPEFRAGGPSPPMPPAPPGPAERRRHAPLPFPYLRSASPRACREYGAPVGLGASHPRPWRSALHRPARPLRPDPDRGGPRVARVQDRRDRARRVGHPHRRRGEGPHAGDRQRQAAHGRGRGLRTRDRGAGSGQGIAAAGLRRAGIPGGRAPSLPLPRPASRDAPSQHHAPHAGRRVHAPPHERDRLQRIPDADPDRFKPGGRARLPRALAPPQRHVLRAAAGAAAVQAAADDVGLRPLFPDRALLPRRGPARRPLLRRVLPARPRNELRRAGGHLPDDGARDPGIFEEFADGKPSRRPSAAFPTPTRSAATAPTSPTCATRSRCRP